MSLPPLPDAFEWTRESWGAALRCRPLADLADHLFTTRDLALSSAADVARLASAAGASRAVLLSQVHGSAVVRIRHAAEVPDGRPEADVLVSNVSDVALVVRAADCVPLLLADPESGAVAAVHAGWRGTAARAAVAAVEALTAEFGSRPQHLVAAIGPAIGRCCYEVGPDVVDAFAAAGHRRDQIDRWFTSPVTAARTRRRPLYLDVPGANRDQLVLAGVPEAQIHLSGLCTAMHLDILTSYRAEREAAGRLAGVIRASAPRRHPSLRSPAGLHRD